MPLGSRAQANSIVLVGGRVGFALAPLLTAWLVVRFGNWRPVLWLDGGLGVLVAAVYFGIVRNRPQDHPAANAAERDLISTAPWKLRAHWIGRRPSASSATTGRFG